MHFAVIYCRIGLWRHHFKDGGYGYFLELRNLEKKISPETSWSTKDCVIDAYLACEQALLFGRAKRAAREGARGRQSRLLSRASRACTFHDIPQMESLLAG